VFNPAELKGYTWPNELAQAIVFTSPFLCYADHPRNYLANPALDVLKSIPPVWDETVVLPGSAIGECAAFARRSGDRWFVGAVNGAEPRKLSIPLAFLGPGKFRAIELADAPGRDDAFARTERTVEAGGALEVSIRPKGGYVARFEPVK
jgi:alpha-glucosidase